MDREQEIRTAPGTSSLRSERVAINKKRVFVAILFLGILLALGVVWVKDALPRFLAEQEKRTEMRSKEAGRVAGETDVNFDILQEQIDRIKRDVSDLKPEDLAKQRSVQKIIDDLETLKQKASESAEIFDIKGNLCEEAKKKFCQ